MQILIVEHDPELAGVWAGFLARTGVTCRLAHSADAAFDALRERDFAAVVLDTELPDKQALAVADYATYRDPDIPIIAVTARGFFSDSAIFELIPNARGVLRTPPRPEDMAALVEHYGGRRAARALPGSGG